MPFATHCGVANGNFAPDEKASVICEPCGVVVVGVRHWMTQSAFWGMSSAESSEYLSVSGCGGGFERHRGLLRVEGEGRRGEH